MRALLHWTGKYKSGPFCLKRDFNAIAKSIEPGQPAQSEQADLGRYFLRSVNFLEVKGQGHVYLIDSVGGQNGYLWIHN